VLLDVAAAVRWYDAASSANLEKVSRKELDVILHHLDNTHGALKDRPASEVARLQQQLIRQVFVIFWRVKLSHV
jgi:hypothetical protein